MRLVHLLSYSAFVKFSLAVNFALDCMLSLLVLLLPLYAAQLEP